MRRLIISNHLRTSLQSNCSAPTFRCVHGPCSVWRSLPQNVSQFRSKDANNGWTVTEDGRGSVALSVILLLFPCTPTLAAVPPVAPRSGIIASPINGRVAGMSDNLRTRENKWTDCRVLSSTAVTCTQTAVDDAVYQRQTGRSRVIDPADRWRRVVDGRAPMHFKVAG